jgi:hypothetical protein
MTAALPQPAGHPRRVQLPCSSTRLDRPHAHLLIIERVRLLSHSPGFEGKICAPGSLVDWERLPDPCVVLECAGYRGPVKRGSRREMLWILWKYDRASHVWCQIAQASAVNWEWALALRGAAIDSLDPKPELIDLRRQTREEGDRILELIERELEKASPEVRAGILARLHAEIAGRLAELG